MTDAPPQRPMAILKHGRWPGLIWAVPLAALLVVLYLGLHALAQRGIDIVITVDSADGVVVGDTRVMYRGVSVGHVTGVDLAKDGKRVDVTVRVTPRLKPALVSSTEFWLVGAKPDLTDIASLKAALEGVTIGIAPGATGEPTRHFDGLQAPPIVMPGTPGRNYVLTGDQLGSIRPGSDVFYRGLKVGSVTAVALAGEGKMRLGVFVRAPYDQLVRPDTAFWIASPLQVSLSGKGLVTQILPDAALSGGVEFETDTDFSSEEESPADSGFVLYDDQTEALSGGKGPQVLYDIRMSAAAGDLSTGAPVKLGAFRIGAVRKVHMTMDGQTGMVDADVTVEIEPQRLNLTHVTAPADGNWRPVADAALNKLFARGYRAGLSQSPPLIGASYISIEQVESAGPASLTNDGAEPVLPSRNAGDFGAIIDKLGAIADKLDAVPIAAIGENIRQLTAHLAQLTGSPELAESIKHLNSTLDQVDRMMREVRPQIGPLVANLNQAADQLQKTATAANKVLGGQGSAQDSGLPEAIRELTEAARSIRSLTDYLGRHPEALLLGKSS